MEIFRQWGLAGEVWRRALAAERCLGFVWVTRMNGLELGHILFGRDARELRDQYARHSPELPSFVPQDRLERLLMEEVRSGPSVTAHLGWELIELARTPNEVQATVSHRENGERSIRARYVVGADGARSAVRRLAGIGEDGAEPWGEAVNIYFESAEFDALRRDRPYQLWWVVNADVRGAFWPVSHENRWIFTPEGIPDARREPLHARGLRRPDPQGCGGGRRRGGDQRRGLAARDGHRQSMAPRARVPGRRRRPSLSAPTVVTA